MPVRGSRLDHALLLLGFPGLILLATFAERAWLAPRSVDRTPAERVALWREHVERNPGFAMGFLRLGQTLVEVGDPDGAREAFQKALDLSPDNVSAALGLSDVMRVEGNLAGSIELMERFLERQPGCAECYQNIAADRLSLGDLDGAQAAIEQVLERRYTTFPSASGTSFRAATTQLLAGRIHEAQGRQAEALRYYESALRADPSLGFALLRVGEMKMGSDPTQAADLLARYRQQRPRDPHGARLLAEALTRLGDAEGARRVLAEQRAAAAQPRHLPTP